MLTKLSENAIQIGKEGRSKLTMNKTGSKLSVNICGPRGGNEQAMLVDADDLLEALVEVGSISNEAAWNFIEIVTDGKCLGCYEEKPDDGGLLCESCFSIEVNNRQ